MGVKELAQHNERRQRDWQTNRAYFLGRNPWLESREPRKEPDNRIAIPFAKMAVEDMAGYSAMPGYRTVEIDNVRTDGPDMADEYVQRVREAEAENDSERLTSELYTEALTQGYAYELFWFADGEVNFARVPSNEIEIVYDGGLRPEPIEAWRFYDRNNGSPNKAVKFTAFDMTEYRRDGSSWTVGDTIPHPFGMVPVTEYCIGASKLPFFESEKGIIDAQDKLISSSVNEVDRFNAVMALFPFQVSKEFVEKLRQMNVIDDLEQYERWPEYLEKSLQNIEAFYANLADRLERLFHKSIKVPDFSDENFVGNASGVALSYKLLGLEFKAAQIDTYFDMGTKRRYKLIGRGINAGAREYPLDDYEVSCYNRRNLPVDEQKMVQIAQSLLGIVSRETLLRILPQSIVQDVEREIERLDDEPSMTLGDSDDTPPAELA